MTSGYIYQQELGLNQKKGPVTVANGEVNPES